MYVYNKMRKVLSVLLALVLVVLPAATAVAAPLEEESQSVTRLAGVNRYETAAKIARTTGEIGGRVVVTSGDNYADALSASMLAAPILLVAKDSVPAATEKALEELQPAEVIVVGGEASVSQAVYQAVYATERIAGANRYETNQLVVSRVFNDHAYEQVILVSGENYPDAVTASAVAAGERIPLLLTQRTFLPEGAYALLSGKKVTIIGGSNSVDDSVADFVSGVRISGANRYETAVKVFNQYFNQAGTIVLATGQDYPDALAAGFFAATLKTGIVLGETVSAAGTGRDIVIVSGSGRIPGEFPEFGINLMPIPDPDEELSETLEAPADSENADPSEQPSAPVLPVETVELRAKLAEKVEAAGKLDLSAYHHNQTCQWLNALANGQMVLGNDSATAEELAEALEAIEESFNTWIAPGPWEVSEEEPEALASVTEIYVYPDGSEKWFKVLPDGSKELIGGKTTDGLYFRVVTEEAPHF